MKAHVTYHLTTKELGEILREYFSKRGGRTLSTGHVEAHADHDYLDRPTGGHSFVFTGYVADELEVSAQKLGTFTLGELADASGARIEWVRVNMLRWERAHKIHPVRSGDSQAIAGKVWRWG